MGSKTQGYIDKIEQRLDDGQGAINNYNALLKIYERFNDDGLPLLEEQIAIVNGRYQGDLRQAEQDDDYIAVTKKIDARDRQDEKHMAKLNDYAVTLADTLSDIEDLLNKFDSFLDGKAKATKAPWNKRSLKNARTFVRTTRDTIGKIKVPKPKTIFAE